MGIAASASGGAVPWRDRLTAPAAARAVFAASVVLLGVGVTLGVLARTRPDPAVELGGAGEAFELVMMVPTLVIGVLLASRRPQNPVGWIFVAVGLALGWAVFASGYVEYGAGARPGSLPAALEVGSSSEWIGALAFFLPAAFLFLVFPDGHLVSRRFRFAVWAGALAVPLGMVGIALDPRVEEGDPFENPLALESAPEVAEALAGIGTLLVFLTMGIGLASLVLRYRRGSFDQRLQIKWIAFAAALLLSSSLTFHVIGPLVLSSDRVKTAGDAVAAFVLLVGLPAAVAIGVLRHRLFDIDRLIRRSVVYGVLWLVVTLVFAGIAAGLGIAAGRRWPLWVAVVITVVFTVGFEPVRRRLETLIDRWVYGGRARGYELVAELGSSLQAAFELEDVVPRLATTVQRGLDLRWARVSLSLDATGGRTLQPFAASGIDLDDLTPPQVTTTLVHGGVEVGVIECGPKVEGELTTKDRELLESLAGHAAVAIRNAGLAAELAARVEQIRAQADELGASRARIVQAQAEERRRTERDIHDGAQQELVGLIAKLRLARDQLRANVDRAEDALIELQHDAQAALQGLRELAQGIHPSVLTDRGLVAAIEARADRSPIPVRLDVAPSVRWARFSDDVESAAYYAVSEALTNALKHAAAGVIQVCVGVAEHRLQIDVVDDGIGFDPQAACGSGLTGLADRLEALGGTLTVRAGPTQGTVVTIELRAEPRLSHA